MIEFKETVDRIGWSIAETSRRLGCNIRTVQRWYSGINAAPPEVVLWLMRIAGAIEAIKPPEGWGARFGGPVNS